MRAVKRITVWYEDGTSRGVPAAELCAACRRKMSELPRYAQGPTPQPERTALMRAMRVEDGMLLEEIADVMGVSRQAVWSRLKGVKRGKR